MLLVQFITESQERRIGILHDNTIRVIGGYATTLDLARAAIAAGTGLAQLADSAASAEQTGGISIRNTNDLSDGVRRVLEDQKGFYLIGFRPSEDLFLPLQGGKTRFNKFEVKVRRAGLSVRTRAGFYGFAEGAKRPAPRTRAVTSVICWS